MILDEYILGRARAGVGDDDGINERITSLDQRRRAALADAQIG